jgi:hypothetical protein
LAEADSPLWQRLLWFTFTLGAALWLTAYTIAKSKRLSDFLDALSDDRLSCGGKWRALTDVWRR